MNRPIVEVYCVEEGPGEWLATGEVEIQGHDGIVTEAWANSQAEATLQVLRVLTNRVQFILGGSGG